MGSRQPAAPREAPIVVNAPAAAASGAAGAPSGQQAPALGVQGEENKPLQKRQTANIFNMLLSTD